MIEKIQKINNPLTIIAIFAALAEVTATVTIGLIDKSHQGVFIWFIMLFPTLLICSFFATLNFNAKVLYSPSDFREDKNYLENLYGPKFKNNVITSKKDSQLTSVDEKLVEGVINNFQKKINNNKEDDFLNKRQIKSLLEESKAEEVKNSKTSSNKPTPFLPIPPKLSKEILFWRAFPAYLPIVFAIFNDNICNIKGLKNVQQKYNFPGRWEAGGLPNLNDILNLKDGEFNIKSEDKELLTQWVKLNEDILMKISDNYKESKTDDLPALDESARILAQELKI